MGDAEPEVATVDVPALRAWLGDYAREIAANRDLLTRLDSAIGDADHGSNFDRGLAAVVAALDAPAPATPADLLKKTGMTLVSTIGGASGPLYGTFFLRMGTSVPGAAALDAAAFDAAAFGTALRAGLEGIVARGRAEAGDKTMYDALAPGCDAYDAAIAGGASLGAALTAAAAAAAAGRDATTPMLARKGRASYLGERSIGHQDPGAASSAMLLAAAARTLGPGRPDEGAR
jgi:phosphoenolpyruvate---glycerone phosphotransferase subunit DhaL